MALVLRVLSAAMFASAVLLTATSAELNEMIYAVTVSSRLTAGIQETLCAHVQNPTERISLTITLTVGSTNSVILKDTVPTVLIRTIAEIQVTLEGQGASMSKKTKVVIEPPGFIHIVQTDKPIYKPGQTGGCPMSDPNSNRIAQWLNQTIGDGILDLSHPSIPEAAQGTYTISIVTDKGEEISHNFDIKEYGEVDLPSVITILDKTTTFKICGKYTYGKPVLGEVTAEFCRKVYIYFWHTEKPNNDICKSYNLIVSCYLCVCYNLGVIIKGSGTTTLSSQIKTITFEDVPAAYRPGIPFEGKIKVVGPDNRPVANELLYLFVEDSKKMVLTTDSSGITHNSFLKLKQISQGFACDRDATVTAEYIIQGKEWKKNQPVLNFFYLVCVSLKFSSVQQLPAEKTTLTVKANPKSLCSVRAIDQSILLLKPEQELTVDYDIGVKIVTNSDVKKPNDCFLYKLDGMFCRVLLFSPFLAWAASAFCVSPTGFGVSPNTGLIAFQPFFVSLTMPYSVIRGEVFTLKATVFNYLSQCIMVTIHIVTQTFF
ncbi:hypothetical protein GOODEAATRI_005428 [Goodea atripinnis]|uniref:Alpha-2-macroglobulin domain-containing protein n=1 Tax=Goodea atripinnis TaxID=208336 RepID=A0ABV0PVH0_9TELE